MAQRMSDKSQSRSRFAGARRRWILTGLALAIAAGILGYDRIVVQGRDPARLDAALRLAIVECRADDVRALIDRGADPNRHAPPPASARPLPPESGPVPVEAYVRCADTATLQALRDGGANLMPYLRWLADLSLQPPQPAIIAWLLRNGLPVEARWPNPEGWETLAHLAARRGQPGVLEAVLDAGADPEAPDSEGLSPLERVERIVASQNAAIAAPVPGGVDRLGGYDPDEYYADVIALLQEAARTE